MPNIDDLVEDVRVVAVQPRDFLFDSDTSLIHQVLVTAIPQLVAVSDRTLDTVTRRLDRVLTHYFPIDGRQIPVPVDNPVVGGRLHVTPRSWLPAA
jgi:hypothetical protein